MQNFLHRARAAIQPPSSSFPAAAGAQQTLKAEDTPSTIQPPTLSDLFRYRYHHGTNVGSIFVLEQWLFGSMFVEGAAGGSEFDAVNASLNRNGLDATKQKWEQHWASAVTDDDWAWLVKTARCTTIRLPIGYFTLGPAYCVGTPFAVSNTSRSASTPAQVYEGAWAAVTRLVAAARARGIGVLLDLHALPGGANADAHSGTSSGHVGLWTDRSARELATRCAVFVAQEARQMENVVGVQLCNEAVYGASGMYDWYDEVLAALSTIDPTMPVYISDAWDLGAALRYSTGRNGPWSHTNPVVIDTHKYYTFADADKQQAPQQIIGRVRGELHELGGHEGNVFDHGAAQVVVGEYSCVLDEQTWSTIDGGQRAALIQHFGRAQSQRWREKAAGSYFWTLKMNWMDGGEWGFVAQTKSGAITAPPSLLLPSGALATKLSTARSQAVALKRSAVSSHAQYWTSTAPNANFEHWRFEQGWDVGFADAMAFFAMRVEHTDAVGGAGDGADTIGLLDLWVRRRIQDSGMGGALVWEFEQGLRQGVAEFYTVVGA
ncbi:MAG: Glucan 1,3-beta-glucosidase 3 [Thelocarpon superellum]|nr:MAG: Glucan 1,3-beta-glucosidase 3 [Thelocarpon superellum]